MPPVSELGELQLAVMHVLWARREASAAEVHAELARDRDIALTTVSTILQRLEKRELVSHRAEGRLFVYRAAVSQPDVRQSMLGSLVRSLFANDPTAVVSELLASGDVSAGDVERMRAMLADARGGADRPAPKHRRKHGGRKR